MWILDSAKSVKPLFSVTEILRQIGHDGHQMNERMRTSSNSREVFDYSFQSSKSYSQRYSTLLKFLLIYYFSWQIFLRDPNQPPTSLQLQEAAKIRKRLIDSFGQYDKAARRIRDLPTESPTQKKLQKAIYQQATNFLHLHMLPLKSLPKVLKHATPNGRLPNESPVRSGTSSPAPGARSRVSALASIGYAGNGANTSTNSVASDNSSAISALEAEEKALRERLIVLEEQKFFVSEMIADANKRRKFDEVSSLAMNVEDLTKEIDHVSGQLNKLDFEGIYTGTQPRAWYNDDMSAGPIYGALVFVPFFFFIAYGC